MKCHTAIITDGITTWEEQHLVPNVLNPEDCIKTKLRRFNETRRCNHKFVKLKRIRRNGNT
jgi:hypothetical protein